MKTLSVPAAIVGGFGLLSVATGLGLFFGLRSRAAPPVDSPRSVATITAATPHAIEASAQATPTMPVANEAARTEASDATRGAIDGQHAHFVEACWNPSFAKSPLPAQVKFTLSLQYAEDGRLAGHALRPDVPGARPDVTSCVYGALVIPPIAPLGRRMQLSVPITLP